MAATSGRQPASLRGRAATVATTARRTSSAPTGATPATRPSRCCGSRSPSPRSRSASTSSSTSSSTGRSTSPPGSTTSRPAPARTSCTSSAPSRSSPASIVALKPRYGAYVVAAWLAGIVINLLTASGYYDIALRDFGLMLAALTLARLASVYDPRSTRPPLSPCDHEPVLPGGTARASHSRPMHEPRDTASAQAQRHSRRSRPTLVRIPPSSASTSRSSPSCARWAAAGAGYSAPADWLRALPIDPGLHGSRARWKPAAVVASPPSTSSRRARRERSSPLRTPVPAPRDRGVRRRDGAGYCWVHR